jgi:hypothetical protein
MIPYNSSFILVCFVLATVSFFCSGLVVVAHSFVPHFRKHPGQMIVVLCVAQMIFDSHWLTSLESLRK